MLFGRRTLLRFCIVSSSVVRRSGASALSRFANRLKRLRQTASRLFNWGARLALFRPSSQPAPKSTA